MRLVNLRAFLSSFFRRDLPEQSVRIRLLFAENKTHTICIGWIQVLAHDDLKFKLGLEGCGQNFGSARALDK